MERKWREKSDWSDDSSSYSNPGTHFCDEPFGAKMTFKDICQMAWIPRVQQKILKIQD
jgi:hypothetical protein